MKDDEKLKDMVAEYLDLYSKTHQSAEEVESRIALLKAVVERLQNQQWKQHILSNSASQPVLGDIETKYWPNNSRELIAAMQTWRDDMQKLKDIWKKVESKVKGLVSPDTLDR